MMASMFFYYGHRRRHLLTDSTFMLLPVLTLIFSVTFLTKTSGQQLQVVSDQQQKVPIFSMCDPQADPPQCGANAVCGVLLPEAGICELGICMCTSPEFAPLFTNATDCGRLLTPGDKCTADSDSAMLIPEFAQCVNGQVTCTQDLIAANGTCVPPNSIKTIPGDICDEAVKCHGGIGLECARSTRLTERGTHCQCASNLIFKNGRCQPALFGDPCTNDDHCNVIYDERPGASRSICRNGTCVCGDNYIKVGAVVQTPPSSTLLSDMNPNKILGYYCFSISLVQRMSAGMGENCSVPLPKEPFDLKITYCSDGLVCLHCAESGLLSRGKCANMTELFASAGQKKSTAQPPPTPPPTSRPDLPEPAKSHAGANLYNSRRNKLDLLLSIFFSLIITTIISNNSAFYYQKP